MEGKFTFSHFLIQFIERWFNQFPSLWRGFSTTTYFRHFLLLKKRTLTLNANTIFAFLPSCTLEPSSFLSPGKRTAHDNMRVYCRLKVRHFGKTSGKTPGGGTTLFGLYGDVPLDRVWFFGLAVLNRVYNLTCLCPKQVKNLS